MILSPREDMVSPKEDVILSPKEDMVLSLKESHSIHYDWTMPEPEIIIPLHPLIAEARRHAARSLIPGYSYDLIPTWPSTLATAGLSMSTYAEEDMVVLNNYLVYVKMWHSRSSSKHTEAAQEKQ